jgi:hypothetical protein
VIDTFDQGETFYDHHSNIEAEVRYFDFLQPLELSFDVIWCLVAQVHINMHDTELEHNPSKYYEQHFGDEPGAE